MGILMVDHGQQPTGGPINEDFLLMPSLSDGRQRDRSAANERPFGP